MALTDDQILILAFQMSMGSREYYKFGNKRMIAFARALLAAHPVADVVVAPEGWKLVPIEPTEEMIRAGNAAIPNQLEPAMHAWDSMLAAASQPPVINSAIEAVLQSF